MKGNIIENIEAKMHMSEKKIGSESAIENEMREKRERERERERERV